MRWLLDLQYRSLIEAEKFLLQDFNFKAIKVLDFGAGSQEFAKRNNCAYYNSLDPYFAATWKTEGDIPPGENFDLIVSTEVFEHLENPTEILYTLAQFQKPGQKIYLTTPFLAREHGAPQDYQRWTEQGLVKLLERAGYTTEKIIRRGNLISVLSAFLNYKLFKSLNSRYFLVAMLLAPFAIVLLILAHLTLGRQKHSDTYLGLSLLAVKSGDL